MEQLNAMTVWQRLQIRDWRLEIFTMGFIAIFVFLFKAGDLYNKSKVTGFLSGISEVMNKQFYQFGVSPNQLYIKDSSENYSSYATGRVNIASVQINFTLVPRYNVFLWILESGFHSFLQMLKHQKIQSTFLLLHWVIMIISLLPLFPNWAWMMLENSITFCPCVRLLILQIYQKVLFTWVKPMNSKKNHHQWIEK